jgi:hypothetical protein
VSEHEDHERFMDDCPECDAEMDAMMRAYRPAPGQFYSKAEEDEMRADRELMRDEYHQI